MKQRLKKLSVLITLCIAITLLGGCNANTDNTGNSGSAEQKEPATQEVVEYVDYAASMELNMSSNSAKAEVTVKTFIDGDTTHFNVAESVIESGVLKARYLSVNTPESTGKIEEYGKTASNFTKEKLSQATSIIVESDDANWNMDSTSERHLVWVWYRTSDSENYRNLNIEILQNGLAIANSSAQGRYGSTCMDAIGQAKAMKLNLYSGEKDPNFYYGEAVELTIKELRTNAETYNGMKVAFNGVITTNSDNSVYVEAYDAETDMYYGFSVYYGFGLSGEGLDILSVGNEVRIVGTVQYYEVGGTYQVAGVSYRMMKPDDPSNIQKLSEGHSPAYVLTDAKTFAYGKVEVEVAEEKQVFDYAELALCTSVEIQNLKVQDVYTTSNEESSSNGAMTLTCMAGDTPVVVRTAVLLDADKNLITEDAYAGKSIDVKGIVDFYDGAYQIKVFSADNITIK